jgi:inhibitor of KinA
LGRTPVRLFDTRRDPAVLLAPGDKVRFEPVDRQAYDRLEAEAAAGRLVIEPAEGSA